MPQTLILQNAFQASYQGKLLYKNRASQWWILDGWKEEIWVKEAEMNKSLISKALLQLDLATWTQVQQEASLEYHTPWIRLFLLCIWLSFLIKKQTFLSPVPYNHICWIPFYFLLISAHRTYMGILRTQSWWQAGRYPDVCACTHTPLHHCPDSHSERYRHKRLWSLSSQERNPAQGGKISDFSGPCHCGTESPRVTTGIHAERWKGTWLRQQVWVTHRTVSHNQYSPNKQCRGVRGWETLLE